MKGTGNILILKAELNRSEGALSHFTAIFKNLDGRCDLLIRCK